MSVKAAVVKYAKKTLDFIPEKAYNKYVYAADYHA